MPAGQLKALGMTPAAWQRHASPWSVYTRMATLPVLVLAIWSHVWVGATLAALATLAVMVWLWINPRLFPPPRCTANWASKATFGERIWLNRLTVPIPEEDARAALTLSLVTGIGFVATIYGALSTNLLLTLPGLLVTYTAKLVFLDRMVGLYDKMHNAHPLYRFWAISPVNDNARRTKKA